MNPRSWGRDITKRIDHRKIPAAVMELVYLRQGHRRCVYCVEQGLETPGGEPLEIDHKRPLHDGGSYHHMNLQVTCRAHNRGKGARRDAPDVPTWARGPK